MNEKKYIKNTPVYNICLTAILMGLTLSSYYLTNMLPIGYIGSFNIHLLFYIFGIVLLKEKSFRIFFFFSIPFLSIFNTNILAINPIQVFVEYFLVYYCFFILLFFETIFKKDNKRLNYLFLVIAILISFSFKIAIHVISGVIWWGAGNLYTSLLINLRMLLLDFIIIIPVALLLVPILNSFKVSNF